jgi:hypothetical protein
MLLNPSFLIICMIAFDFLSPSLLTVATITSASVSFLPCAAEAANDTFALSTPNVVATA